MSEWRPFVCGGCGHRLRVRGGRCKVCLKHRSLMQRVDTYVWAGVLLACAVGFAAIG